MCGKANTKTHKDCLLLKNKKNNLPRLSSPLLYMPEKSRPFPSDHAQIQKTGRLDMIWTVLTVVKFLINRSTSTFAEAGLLCSASDYRSRGRKFEYQLGHIAFNWSWNHFKGHSPPPPAPTHTHSRRWFKKGSCELLVTPPPSTHTHTPAADSRRAAVSCWWKNVHEYWLTA